MLFAVFLVNGVRWRPFCDALKMRQLFEIFLWIFQKGTGTAEAVPVLVGRYQEDAKSFPKGDEDENFHFTRAGSYDVHFPPSLQGYYDKAKSPEINHANCKILDKKEDLIWSDEITA